MKKKERVHREWFRIVLMGGRKSCPNCRAKLGEGESIWSWGNYVHGKWRTVGNFCKSCWPDIRADLIGHKAECGCDFELVGKGTRLPEWLTLACPTQSQPATVSNPI